MLFFCFAVKDRMPLINDFFQFLGNFGLNIWYDRRNIYLGDYRYATNIEMGAKNEAIKYAIIFFSGNFPLGNICLDEYNILVSRFHKGEIHLFPIFIEPVPENIDPRFSLCKELVYRTMLSSEDYYRVALHIVAKITADNKEKMKFKSIKQLILGYAAKDSLIYNMLVAYDNLEKTNYGMRTCCLFYLYMAISHGKVKNYMHFKTMNYIYHRNCLSLFQEEKRELQVMENIVVYEFGSLV